MSSKWFWYHLQGRFSRCAFPTKAKALTALRKARKIYAMKGGCVLSVDTDNDAQLVSELLELIGREASVAHRKQPDRHATIKEGDDARRHLRSSLD
jgi:hypothetical protein